jgi:hypothetical protein
LTVSKIRVGWLNFMKSNLRFPQRQKLTSGHTQDLPASAVLLLQAGSASPNGTTPDEQLIKAVSTISEVTGLDTAAHVDDKEPGPKQIR